MGCQKAIATKIKSKGADYVLAVKGNQGHLHQSIKDFFTICREDDFSNVPHPFHEEVDAGHGRIESRKYWISDTLTSVKDLTEKWDGLISVDMAESERHINGKVSKEVLYLFVRLKSMLRFLLKQLESTGV